MRGRIIRAWLKARERNWSSTQPRSIFAALLCFLFCAGVASGAETTKENPSDWYNVVWTSPTKYYNGSMPIGNGELAANVWVEPTGDLIFYLSRSDTWTGGGPKRMAGETTVEGRVEGGELQDLKVTPESRTKDIVNVHDRMRGLR